MRFDRLSLRNFKCFADADVAFEQGVTVVHGINGSGKSSLLEATFFALYGATAIDRTLDEIVTLDAEEAEIELWFTHAGDSYHLSRRVRATGERASTADCTLEGPDETLTGVGDVEDRVRTMLRMDAEAFVNSAFVRQGEINKLIEASPGDRKRMIDRLLQLGRLETYRERSTEARLGVESVRENHLGRLESLSDQIEAKDKATLHDRKSTLETAISELGTEIEELESGREEARETLSEAESILDSYESKQEELETVTERIGDIRERIATAETNREDLAEEIADLREEISEEASAIEDRVEALDLTDGEVDTVEAAIRETREHKESLAEEIMDRRESVQAAESEADSAADKAEDLRERAEETQTRIEEVSEEIESLESEIAEAKDTIRAAGEQIASHREAFEEAPFAFGEAASFIEEQERNLESVRAEATELRESVATVEHSITEAEDLLAAGKCPECGQPVEGSPHVVSLEADRERLEELEAALDSVTDRQEAIEAEIENAKELRERERSVESLEADIRTQGERLVEKRQTLASKRARVDDLQTEVAELEAAAESATETAESARERAAEIRSAIGERNERRTEATERIERLEALLDRLESLDDLRDQVKDRQERRGELADRNEERRETLADLRERKQHLDEAIDEDRVATARQDKEDAEAYLEQVETSLESKRAERDEKQSELGAVTKELAALDDLEATKAAVESKVAALDSLHEELSELEAMYGELRADLRQRNVDRLESLLNETFELVYRNDAYARIELDGAYELTVYQKDGSALDPDQLSGGERALFNLSLRAAIYRLLVEGIDGAAPMPPLILDEPTVFLDAGHVTQLVSLVESMRELGVEQIIVVSHDEELIGAADDLIRVQKDPTTNRSTVKSVQPSLPGG